MYRQIFELISCMGDVFTALATAAVGRHRIIRFLSEPRDKDQYPVRALHWQRCLTALA